MPRRFAMYDLNEIIRHMNNNYEELYKKNDNIAGYRDAVKWFDYYMKNSKELQDLVNKLVIKRQDPISSDREAAALAFALDEMGICDKIEGVADSDAVEEFLDDSANQKQSIEEQATILKDSNWLPFKYDKDNGTLLLVSDCAFTDDNGRTNWVGLLINIEENPENISWEYNHDEPYDDKELQQTIELLEKDRDFDKKIEAIIADVLYK